MKDMSRLSLACSRMARVGVLILAATASSQAGWEPRRPVTAPQSATQSPAQTFRASADYVEVDVYVTDGQGRFVRDLRKEQFRVFESGQPHDVATLQLVDIPRAMSTARAGTTTSPDPRASASDAAPGPGRLYFLVLDDLHTRPEGSPRARVIASQFVERCVTSADRALVVFTSGRQDAASALTANTKALQSAVVRFVGHKVPSPTVMSAAGPGSAGLMPNRTQPGGDERLDQARSAMNTLGRVVDYAGSFHGLRKTIVLISEGVDIDLGATSDRLRDVRDQIIALTDKANRANATIYAIDPRGVTQGGEHAVELTGSGASQPSLQNELRASQAGLQTLAERTFGMAFVNTGDFDRAYRLIDEASSTYYVLTYSSSTPTDGKFHPVEVRIDLPGVTVRARKGFVKSAVTTTPPPPATSSAPAPPKPPPIAPVATPAAPASAATSTPAAAAPSAAPAMPATAGTQPAAARNLDDLVSRARAYVVEYGAELSLVIGVERYRQWVLNSDASTLMGSGGARPWSRESVSEFALVRIKDDWLGYRDVYQVDGKTVGDRQDRLLQLFQKTPATAVDQGRRIADESARYNAGGMQRNFNVPTMALFFLHPSNAKRFRFDLVGTETIDGTLASKIRYRETQKPTIIRTSAGKDMPVGGIFWIDPVKGRILKTSLEITGEAQLGARSGSMAGAYTNKAVRPGEWADGRVDTYSRVSTTYKLDERIGLLLPAEMVEEYQGVSRNQATGEDRITKINCRATYSDFKKFETGGRIVGVK